MNHFRPTFQHLFHVKWVPFHHGMTRPQVADGGEGYKTRRIDGNVWHKKSLAGDRVWPSSFVLCEGPKTPHRKNLLRNGLYICRLGWILRHDLSAAKWT
jgi:hypothetical protein